MQFWYNNYGRTNRFLRSVAEFGLSDRKRMDWHRKSAGNMYLYKPNGRKICEEFIKYGIAIRHTSDYPATNRWRNYKVSLINFVKINIVNNKLWNNNSRRWGKLLKVLQVIRRFVFFFITACQTHKLFMASDLVTLHIIGADVKMWKSCKCICNIEWITFMF